MKRYTIVTVILVLTALLAAGCRGGGNPPTTLPTTIPVSYTHLTLPTKA